MMKFSSDCFLLHLSSKRLDLNCDKLLGLVECLANSSPHPSLVHPKLARLLPL